MTQAQTIRAAYRKSQGRASAAEIAQRLGLSADYARAVLSRHRRGDLGGRARPKAVVRTATTIPSVTRMVATTTGYVAVSLARVPCIDGPAT